MINIVKINWLGEVSNTDVAIKLTNISDFRRIGATLGLASCGAYITNAGPDSFGKLHVGSLQTRNIGCNRRQANLSISACRLFSQNG